jgi:Flp pilus assembly protein TadD
MGNGLRRVKLAGGIALVLGLSGCAGFDLLGSAGSLGNDQAATLVRMGDYAMSQGDEVTAIALYEQALAVDPDASDARARLGQMQQQVGASVSALDTYRQAVERAPNDPEALRRLGNALIAETYPERAMTYLQQALAIQDSSQVRNSLGVALDLVGQHSLAREQYQAGIGNAPADLDLKNNLALSMALDGDYDGAVALAGEVTDDGAATSRHRQTYALVLGLAGREDEAQAVATLDLSPAQVAANLDYYQLLRSIEPSAARALAITGGMGAPDTAIAQVGFAFESPDDPNAVMIATLPH